jgi:hypothetical protein
MWDDDDQDGAGDQYEQVQREDLVTRLTAHGFDRDVLADLPLDALAEILRVCTDKDDQIGRGRAGNEQAGRGRAGEASEYQYREVARFSESWPSQTYRTLGTTRTKWLNDVRKMLRAGATSRDILGW